jgi:hypothetical protein
LPHAWQKPTFGQTTQLPFPEDLSESLSATEITRIHQIVGTLLYYTRAVDMTLLVALNSLASEQSKGTQHTAKAIVQILNYCATHPNAAIRYHASSMALHIDSDASYLSLPQAGSLV